MKINNYEIKRAESIKFLCVLLGENLTWKPHIKYIENKIAKNVELLFKVKPFLNKQSLLSLYYSYILRYINYANVAWGSTYRTNFKKIIQSRMRIICDNGKFEHTKQLLQSNKILNVYKLNILNVATFMYKVNQKTTLIFFFLGFRNHSILILLDSRNLTTYNQSTILKRVNTQFQLEDHISGTAFLTPKRNKSLRYKNLKLQQNRYCCF